MKDSKYKYIECVCECEEHVLRITNDPQDDAEAIIFSYYLHHWKSIWGRIWQALKYIFCKPCVWGHFDTTIISGDKIDELIDLLEEAKEKYLKYKENKKEMGSLEEIYKRMNYEKDNR